MTGLLHSPELTHFNNYMSFLFMLIYVKILIMSSLYLLTMTYHNERKVSFRECKREIFSPEKASRPLMWSWPLL